MMEELSLNILDIAQNSITAGATKIEIDIEIDDGEDRLTIEIVDNGRGMSSELLSQVENPFVTERTTRKVGLGVSFFKEAAELAGGNFSIRSKLGEGTCVTARFQKSHIDRQPLGDIAQTLTSMILLNPELEFVLRYSVNGQRFDFSTEQIREQLGGEISLSCPEVIAFIAEYLSEHVKGLNEGVLNGGI